MSHKTCTIDGRECFISDSVQPQYILIQTLGDHERGIFDRTAELIAGAAGVPFVLAAFQVFDWDLDLIKTFPGARVSWSINTLDEEFRKAMDKGVSIERRLEAMRQFYEAGVQTTCFISPIFPGITDVEAIIERAKGQCNLVWLENLNLRGDYRPVIMNWIHENHPELDELYHQIYSKKDRSYWTALDQRLREYTAREGMVYVRDDDSKRSDFGELPVVANYFYHEEVKKSAKKQ